jgi:hypothetical protein
MLIAAGGGGRDVWADHGLVHRQSRRSRTRVRAWLVTVGTVGQGTYPEARPQDGLLGKIFFRARSHDSRDHEAGAGVAPGAGYLARLADS